MKKKTVVFGSFAADLMSRSPSLPKPGETVRGSMFQIGGGGKGFNQCVAIHKSGGDAVMITKLGRDSFGELAVGIMNDLGMDTSHLLYSDEASTGVALIMVEESSSQNEIVIVPGACETITDADIEKSKDIISQCEYMLLQLEINIDALAKAAEFAHSKGVKVILNPAPAQHLDDSILSKLELVTPNETEAEILTGIKVDSEENAKKAADALLAKGIKGVIITLGSRGAYVSYGGKEGIVPAFKVDALDTTGAGDAFNGGLLTALAEGMDIWQSARFAAAVAAISVTRLGTSGSMPSRTEVDEFLAKN